MPVYDNLQSDYQCLQQYHEYEAALAWCKENGKRSKAAMAYAAEHQLWERITERGLRRRLDGSVINGEEYMDRRILTTMEELQLAEWLRSENRAGKAKNREETRRKIYDILDLRRRVRVGRRLPSHAHTLTLTLTLTPYPALNPNPDPNPQEVHAAVSTGQGGAA